MATQVLFLADQFAAAPRSPTERHPGGAELTDAVAIESCPWRIAARRCVDADPAELSRYDLIVVANASTASPELLQAVAASRRHVLFEHDLRICRWRGNFPSAPEPCHRWGQRCICPHQRLLGVFESARGVVYLTGLQRAFYHANPWFRPHQREVVLGCSLFGAALLEDVSRRQLPSARHGAALFASRNAIKGYARARRYCRAHSLAASAFRDLPPDAVWERFRRAEVFVYLPLALEPAGRMPVEARLLGCRVVTNGLLGVAGEPFWSGPAAEALSFLGAAPSRFWRSVEQLMHGSAPASVEVRVGSLRRRRLTHDVPPW